jgi:signal transduction histidine kinase
VINLVQNAVEAFPDGASGTVRVRAKYADGWELTITDDGPGIPPDVAARIFEPLFTTKAKGTGLGLAVVKSIVERHGGTIELDSAPGKGTTFRIAWGAPAIKLSA